MIRPLANSLAIAVWMLSATTLLAQDELQHSPEAFVSDEVSDDVDDGGFNGDTCCEVEPVGDCCNTGCDYGCSQCGDCCLGEAWTIHDAVAPCCDHNFGGWIAAGYYTDKTGLSFFAPLNDFNDYPDHFNLDQAWLYVEKIADGSCCSADWGKEQLARSAGPIR
jgi:hypothetical protein